jgi:hypothetical protein
VRGFEAAQGWMRAGNLTVEELESLLQPLLTTGVADNHDPKWPLAYSAAFVIATSAGLWTLIIFGITRLL